MSRTHVALQDRARQVQAMVRAQPGLKPAQIAKQCGVSRATITHVIGVLLLWDTVDRVPDGRGYTLQPKLLSPRQYWLRRAWR